MAVAATLCVALAFASGGGADVSAHPPGLTASGIVLWNFEALLHDTFGSRQPCVVSSGDFVAPAGGCAPLATYSEYDYVFSNPHGSPYHLVVRHFKGGAFGNYPVPVRVTTLYVACDRAAKTFLISFGDAASFSLGCLAPLP